MRAKSIKPLGYRVSWLASLFASNSGYQSLSLAGDGLVLAGGESAQTWVSYLTINLDITVEQGYFWDVLVIPLENGESLRFSGVAKKQSKSLQIALNQLCHTAIKTFYQRSVPDLQQAYRQAHTLFS